MTSLRTRTRPGEFDPLDWVLEHWQAQDRPDAEHFLADEPIKARRAGVVERLVKWARRRPAVSG